MSRQHLSFTCEGETLVATTDIASGPVGLLLVSGGNETRAGAFSGQSGLAARLAAAGYPVLRFDRRGVGDSTGENAGFTGSGPDIAAALQLFRAAQPQIRRVVAFGNCDAASALIVNGGAGCDALALANPWTFDQAQQDAPDSASIRQRYAAKLKNPAEVWRLVTGKVSIAKLARGLVRAAKAPEAAGPLVQAMRQGLAGYSGPVCFLIADNDRTARAFMQAMPETQASWDICADAGHAFAGSDAGDWLFARLSALLDEQARQLNMS
jgi:exosortase A-associated hydrolase 1